MNDVPLFAHKGSFLWQGNILSWSPSCLPTRDTFLSMTSGGGGGGALGPLDTGLAYRTYRPKVLGLVTVALHYLPLQHPLSPPLWQQHSHWTMKAKSRHLHISVQSENILHWCFICHECHCIIDIVVHCLSCCDRV